jgi:5-methyltetrahydropteroyltriglutamate--homocysteine methyltransferase
LIDFVQLEQQAGLDYFSDGLLRWQDIFRPLVEASTAMSPNGLKRWFDNNAFFREPQLRQPLSRISLPAEILQDKAVPQPRVATLPSPFMFSRAAHASGDRNQLMLDLSRHVLRPAVEALTAAGSQVVHLQDPWLAYFGIQPGDWTPLEESLESLHDGISATFVLHVYFGDAGRFADRLRRLPVEAVGVDLVETDIDSLGSEWPIGLLAGCLNGRSSIVEPLESTVELARRIADRVRPRTLYLSSSCDLEFLPAGVARQKVLRLGEVSRRVKELVAV